MKKSLVGLGLFFALTGLVYSWATPLFEAPDEVWHYAYVRYLSEGQGLPSLTDDASGAYQEVAQPPLYYTLAALVSGLASDEDLSELMWHNPFFGYQAGETVNDNKNMLIHTEREQFPWTGAVLAIRLARFVSLALGLLTVVAAWGLGREAFPQQPAWALGAATLVAFLPQFLFISSVTSNDSAAAAFSTAALWALARTANRGSTLRRSLISGVLVGLASLSKTSGLLLVPLAVLVFGLSRGPEETHLSPGQRVVGILVMGGVAFAVGGWWYLRNIVLYGAPLGLEMHVDTPWGRSEFASLSTLVAELPRLYRSFWGGFGWGHVQYPSLIYLVLGVGMVVSLAGWGWAIRQRRLSGRGRVFLLVAAWWGLVFVALLVWMRQVQAPHGRLLFPAIGAWAVLMVGGWSAWQIADSRWQIRIATLFCRLFIFGLIGLGLLTPWLVIRPAFAVPRLLSPDKAATMVEPVELTFGEAAHLIGVSLANTSVTPGDTLSVQACWEAVDTMSRDYTVFVQLLGAANMRVAERRTYPGLGRFPTSLWPIGQAFCESYQLQVESWAPAPELYDVVVGLADDDSGERLAARDAAGDEITVLPVARVRIAPEYPLANDSDVLLDYRLGEQISLIGYQLSGPVQSGAPLTVTLFWRAEETPVGDWTVFVHLLDDQGQKLAQHDGPPRANRYPTSAWQPQDVIPDTHRLPVPALSPDQSVRLVVGMYQPETMERLPVMGPDGPVVDALILLPVAFP